MSLDPTYPLFPVLSFLGFIVCCIPLPWHIQAWNSGTCGYMIWTSTACLIEFVNCIVWTGNLNNPSPVWCDISSKILLGVSVGIPASLLCISRRLYYLTSCQSASTTHQDKRCMIIVDLCISVGAPAIIMMLHYVVQGHRFDILEDIGCYPVVYNTLSAYFLYFMWPVVFGLVSFVFSALTLRSFWIRRAQFSQLVASSSSMSIARYFRLVLLAVLDMLCIVPLGIYSIYIGNKGTGLAPEDTHFKFSHVNLIPTLVWRSDPSFLVSVELTRWLPVVCAFLFFVLFGFASEARKQYNRIFEGIMKRFGIRPSCASANGSTKITIPGWKKPLNTGNASMSSLSEYPPKYPVSYDHHLHSVELELSTYSTIDVEKSAGLSPISSEFSTKFSSPPSNTHESNFMQTDPTFLCKPIIQFSQLKEVDDNVPEYYTTASYPEVYITSDKHPTIEDDTFTVSSFSYYGSAPSPSSPSHRFELTPPTPPSEPQGLSPPPVCPIVKRPIPKRVPSSADADSIIYLSRPSSPVLLPAVPQDVRALLPGRMTMGITEDILVTVHKQSSADELV